MIVSNKHPVIAKEGWLFLAVSLLMLLLSSLFFHLLFVVLFALLFFCLLFVYRDPTRKIPPSPLGIVSPVDGKVSSISKIDNQYCGESSLLISIQTIVFDVHSVRSPIEGKMLKQWQIEENGMTKFLNWIQTDEGDNVVWVALIKGSNRHVPCYVQPGERTGQGQRCGFLPFAVQVDLLIPENSSHDLKIGTMVRAGETIIAHLVHQQGASLISDPTLIIENAG